MAINAEAKLTGSGLGGHSSTAAATDDTEYRQKSMTCIKAPELTNDCATLWCLSAL